MPFFHSFIRMSALLVLAVPVLSGLPGIPDGEQSVKAKSLPRCANNAVCSEYLTDTTRLVNLVRYEQQWIKQVYPRNQLYLEGQQYEIGADIRPLKKTYLKAITFMPNTVNGYELVAKNKKYLLLQGTVLGSLGSGGSTSLVIVFDLQQKWGTKYKAFGMLIKNFQIKEVGDSNKDGIPEIRIGEERRPLVN